MLWYGQTIIASSVITLSNAPTIPRREYYTYPIQHRFGVGVALGFDKAIPLSIPDFSTRGGFIGDISFAYEYINKHFALQTGMAIDFTTGRHRLHDTIRAVHRIEDTQGTFFNLSVTQTKKDAFRVGMLEFPILAGVNYNKFYVLAGLKLGVKIFDATTVKGNISFIGKYDQYITPFEWMPNHGLRAGDYRESNKSYLKVALRFVLEGGYNFPALYTDRRTIIPRLGVFVNVGPYLSKVKVSEQQIAFSETMSELISYNQAPLLGRGNGLVLDVQAGLRFTLFFMNKNLNFSNRNCKGCKTFVPMKQPYCPMCEKQNKQYRRLNRVPETYHNGWAQE